MAGSAEANFSCHLTKEQDKAIFATKLVILIFSLLLNIAVICVLLFFKSFKRFVFRLVLCLLVASLIGVVVQILEIIPLDHTTYPIQIRQGWESTCAAFGFLDQVAIWMSNFVIVWIVVFLCWLMTQPHDKISMFTSEVSVAEAVAICCCFLVPFTFNWIPFTTDYFGPSGHWCWIKLVKNESEEAECEHDRDIGSGVALMFIFYYGPLLLIMLFATVVSVIAVIVWCKNIARSDPIKGMIFIVVYPIIFNLVCCIVTANRIEEIRRVNAKLGPHFGLWMAHAVADPARTLLPACFFLLQFLIPTTRKMVVQTRYTTLSDSDSRSESEKGALYSTL